MNASSYLPFTSLLLILQQHNHYLFSSSFHPFWVLCFFVYWQGPLFLEFYSKIKLGDKLLNLGIFSFKSVIFSFVLMILASPNRLQSLMKYSILIDSWSSNPFLSGVLVYLRIFV